MAEAKGVAKGVAKGKAEGRAEKEKALLGIAKDLLGRGFSVEDAAKITTLEIDKVQALVA
jgi:predicted transposase YdaD